VRSPVVLVSVAGAVVVAGPRSLPRLYL